MAEFAQNHIPKPKIRKNSQSGASDNVSQQIKQNDQIINDYDSNHQINDHSAYGGNYNAMQGAGMYGEQSNHSYNYPY